mgnify:CR=1 FL=1
MFRRYIDTKLSAALGDTRVVLLHGARQTGKSTLARQIAERERREYLTLDDPAILGVARSDPWALVERAGEGIVIDEVQLAPQLFPAIKRAVDQDNRPGRFLLTGSANLFLLPNLSESLAGRIEILTLHPLSQSELASPQGGRPRAESRGADENNFVEALFSADPWTMGRTDEPREAVCRRVIGGGFPEAVGREGARRDAWFGSYVTTLLQRDVRDLMQIEGLTELPRLLSLLAARSSALLNASEIARALGLPNSTVRRYLALLEALFLFQPLPAWSTNFGKRLVKSPKAHLLDSGLAAHLRGETDARALAHSSSLGPLLESFVVLELRKLLTWSRMAALPYHFRTTTGREVDVVLESPDQRVVGIEVKAASNVGPGDFSGLQALREAAGEKFVRGAVLYLGEQRLPYGDGMWALPISTLWRPQ